jgi:nucleoside-diphosphate-sugar epimerase
VKGALIVGCGYTGVRLGARLLQMGLRVTGTTRREGRASELEAVGIETLVRALDDDELVEEIGRRRPALAVYLVPPAAAEDLHLRPLLGAVSGPGLEAFIYASSTAVYGDRAGDWVDETTAARPEGESARARHAAERTVIEAAATAGGTPTRVCRITGIYGPGRTLSRSLGRRDYALIKGHDTWVSRIHVDDLVSGVIAAWQRGGDGRVYNMVDAQPHRASEFANLAADLHGLPRPDWIDATEARGRYDDDQLRRKLANKRVRSVRLAPELGVELRYPTYREGLPAAVREEAE